MKNLKSFKSIILAPMHVISMIPVNASAASKVAAPTASVASGLYNNTLSTRLSCETSGATIKYTTDGTEPTNTSSCPAYNAGTSIAVTKNTTIKAKAFKPGYTDSDTQAFVYNFKAATPTASIASGLYNNMFSVKLQCATADATIRYTTNGAEPDENSAVYPKNSVFNLSGAATIKAKAFRQDFAASNTGTFTYGFKVATPTASIDPQTYNNTFSVTLKCATEGAAIYYTTDGKTEPTTGSTKYTGAIGVSKAVTIKAKAFRANFVDSNTGTFSYALKVASPIASPAAGTYTGAQSVTLSCVTAGAAIYYTTDGKTEPTTSCAKYTGAISVSKATTIKAKAFRTDFADSNTGTYAYAIASPTLTLTPATWETGPKACNTTINVTSNSTWGKPTSDVCWLAISNICPANRTGNGSFKIKAAANPDAGASRKGTITVTAGGVSRKVSVTQAAKQKT